MQEFRDDNANATTEAPKAIDVFSDDTAGSRNPGDMQQENPN